MTMYMHSHWLLHCDIVHCALVLLQIKWGVPCLLSSCSDELRKEFLFQFSYYTLFQLELAYVNLKLVHSLLSRRHWWFTSHTWWRMWLFVMFCEKETGLKQKTAQKEKAMKQNHLNFIATTFVKNNVLRPFINWNCTPKHGFSLFHTKLCLP